MSLYHLPRTSTSSLSDPFSNPSTMVASKAICSSVQRQADVTVTEVAKNPPILRQSVEDSVLVTYSYNSSRQDFVQLRGDQEVFQPLSFDESTQKLNQDEY